VEEIKIQSDAPTGEPIRVLVGFPGSGLVGSIALQYMVDQMKCVHIGNVTSKYFPAVAMMMNGLVNVPVRFYEKDSFLMIVADVPIHPMICYEVANGILDWLGNYQVEEIVILAGIITNEPGKRVFGVATDEGTLKKAEEFCEILPMGSISGIAGSFLSECKLRGLPAIGLLGETVNTPDPRASASVVTVLNNIYNLEIDIAPLLEQATEIEAMMQKVAEQVQQAETMPKKEHLPMYG